MTQIGVLLIGMVGGFLIFSLLNLLEMVIVAFLLGFGLAMIVNLMSDTCSDSCPTANNKDV